MNNRIELQLDKSVTRLAGFEYGKDVYEKQVRGKLDLSDSIILVFPDNVKRLASSFVQGFFGELIDKIGISGIENRVIIESKNKAIRSDIIENLL